METSVVRRRKRSASAERIKNAYNGANNVEVEVIEAVGTAKTDDTPKEMRVCAYCRVSTEEESQQSSYELQVQHYTQYINDHENWTLQGIYADEGIRTRQTLFGKQIYLTYPKSYIHDGTYLRMEVKGGKKNGKREMPEMR